MTQKNPAAAAALNSFFWGTGYSYADIKSPFGFPWLVWPIALVVWYIILFAINYVSLSNILLGSLGLGSSGSVNPFSLYQASCDYAYGGYCLSVSAVYNTAALGAIFAVQFVLGIPLAYDVYKRMGGPGVKGQAAVMAGQPPARICPQCSAPLDAVAEFCPQCGHSVQGVGTFQAGVGGPGLEKRCDNCGTYNPSQYSFCKRCGGKLP